MARKSRKAPAQIALPCAITSCLVTACPPQAASTNDARPPQAVDVNRHDAGGRLRLRRADGTLSSGASTRLSRVRWQDTSLIISRPKS